MFATAPATPDRWTDVVTVMGTRGDPARCWCQYFKLRGRTWESTPRETKRDALHDQVERDPAPPGVLAYAESEPVGWCAVAPKPSYPRLLASRLAGTDTEAADDTADLDRVWAVTCFVVVVGWRRRGVASALLDAAVMLARDHGAAAVEGYPVDHVLRANVASAALYRGTVTLFRDAGFTEVERPAPDRAVMRLRLG
jgi:GNAT superfamily N-acetyltransferase